MTASQISGVSPRAGVLIGAPYVYSSFGFRVWGLSVRPLQPGTLFVPCQMSNCPADAIHGPEMLGCFLRRYAGETPLPFVTGEPELVDQRVRHP